MKKFVVMFYLLLLPPLYGSNLQDKVNAMAFIMEAGKKGKNIKYSNPHGHESEQFKQIIHSTDLNFIKLQQLGTLVIQRRDTDALRILINYGQDINIKFLCPADPVQIFGDFHPLGALLKASRLFFKQSDGTLTIDANNYLMKYWEGRRSNFITWSSENELKMAIIMKLQSGKQFPNYTPLFIKDLWKMVQEWYQKLKESSDVNISAKNMFFIDTFKTAIAAKNLDVLLEIERFVEPLPEYKSIHKHIIGLIGQNADLRNAFFYKTKFVVTRKNHKIEDEFNMDLQQIDQ
jgi:hypothetical protein